MKSVLPDPGPRYHALMQLLRTADTLWNTSHRFFERWDLSPSQFNVLNLLYSLPDGLSQTELSRELIMHRSNLTGLIDRLEKRRLVERREVAGDRRAYRVVLTVTGERLLDEILPRYYQGAADLCEGLTPKHATELASDLRQLALNAERIAEAQRQLSQEK
jgi:DNA-binding MarR family transcriptional regulator